MENFCANAARLEKLADPNGDWGTGGGVGAWTCGVVGSMSAEGGAGAEGEAVRGGGGGWASALSQASRAACSSWWARGSKSFRTS